MFARHALGQGASQPLIARLRAAFRFVRL